MKYTLIILIVLVGTIGSVAQDMKIFPAITTEQKMQFLELVNAERIKAGIRPYKYSFEADTLAKRRNQTAKKLFHIKKKDDSALYAMRDTMNFRQLG